MTSPISIRPAGWVLALLLGVWGCDATEPDEGPPVQDLITSLSVTVNPSGRAPLSAEVTLATREPVSVEVVVEGKGGPGTEIRHRFADVADVSRIPILGLYPGATTDVTLTLFSATGAVLGDRQLTLAAPALADDFPEVEITVPAALSIRPGVNLVSYFGHAGEVTPQRAFAFDAAGDIRWALDVRGDPVLGNLFYDNGIERLANGNLYFGDNTSDRIYEIDMLGRIVRSWELPGFSFHHNVLELPSGNFVATVNRNGISTVEDAVVEVDRQSGAIVTDWDLRRSLDAGRRAWPNAFGDLAVDWFHGNGLAFDPSDETIVVSGRTQGLVKLTRQNTVVWILAPHREWGTAGDGTDLSTKLLQPLDAAGVPITDPAVLDGTATHPDFEWAWYQHAPAVLPDGTLLVFDNGDNRGYQQLGPYSRAVIYRIDDQAMTIQQVWAYGWERGAETFSRIVSDVDYHAAEDDVVFMPGALAGGIGKLVEVDRSSRQVLFEATIRPPIAPFGIAFHRIERLPLYPDLRPQGRR